MTPVHSDQMPMFIGTKLVRAKPMTSSTATILLGGHIAAHHGLEADGYLVEFPDGKPNVHGYTGYVSWSPKRPFEDAYRQTSGMTFGLAVDAMKMGYMVTRNIHGWADVGFLRITNGRIIFAFKDDPGAPRSTWSPTQISILAEDWAIVGMPA